MAETLQIQISKADVYDEVAKTTSYAGAKQMDTDAAAYSRIFTVDEDEVALERFWAEACSAVDNTVKQFITTSNHTLQQYAPTLTMSEAYDTSLDDSVEQSIFSYFVYSISAKWYKYTNKPDVDDCAAMAAAVLNDVRAKIYYRKKPTRTSPV